jgi:hypothetical protein
VAPLPGGIGALEQRTGSCPWELEAAHEKLLLVEIGVAYPQIELRGDPAAVGNSEERSRTWALTTSSPTTTYWELFTPIEPRR